MRTDPRYMRTRAMLTDEAVPRLASGGIALCHLCQRAVYFAGGFLELLRRQLERTARDMRATIPGACPKCGCRKVYRVTRFNRRRCASCRHDFSVATGTARAYAKKRNDWYDKVDELVAKGLNPRQIALAIGLKEPKSIYNYLARIAAERAAASK